MDNFDEANFITYVNNLFIQMMLAIRAKDIKRVDHFVGDKVYNELEEKIKYLNDNNYVQRYDEANVKDTIILNKKVVDNFIVVKVKLTYRALDYITDNDGKFITGNKEVRKETENYLTFKKRIDAKDDKPFRKCPTCGAAIDVNFSGICPNCRNIYDMEEHNYVLYEWSK